MLLVNSPRAEKIWELPFLTVLAPSERYYAKGVRQPKKLTDWARQMGKQVRRWLPKRKIVLVSDSTYAALGLLDSLVGLSEQVYMVTRLRLDAALYEPAPPRGPHQVGRPAKKGSKLPKFKQVLVDSIISWQTLTVANWYGNRPTQVEI